MDAFRTMMLLRTLGLISRSANNTVQLSLGAGIGNKDMYSIHQLPFIASENTQHGARLKFNIKQEQAKSTILVDADPIHSEYYSSLNANNKLHVRAFNEDALIALEELSISENNKINLVTLLRIDHRMLPNVKMFLQLLAFTIENECDFIMTIGSGDNINDFEGRINKINEALEALKAVNSGLFYLSCIKKAQLNNNAAHLLSDILA